ncbi:hypothetical protein QCA50_006998 [Cerrena zonata]|uniref:CMP/dCMP-type deaminase domain-containing protein n=1 Tax=Cerrena zonata TaxID=2478898 RepID=A0AAW0GBS2_9APHY
MKTVVAEAKIVKANGEHPLVAYVSEPFEEEIKEATQLTKSFLSHDTRKSTCHPLRHAALNAIRAIADYRSKETQDGDPPVAGLAGAQESEERRNGSHYLLTSLTVFLSHEPCIMCSMALLHSRVKEIVYLIPMERTGGCGSMTCVPKLEGVNHRYGIMRWRHGVGGILADGLEFDEREDA